jgi:putative lipoprotein
MARALKPILLAVLCTLMASLAIHAAEVTFTGEVSYHERITLPSSAHLRVTLVHLDTGRAVASAEAPIAAGAKPPFGYRLAVRSGVVRSGTAYGLIAEIGTPNAILFKSAGPVAVNAMAPAPTPLLLVHAPEMRVSAPSDPAAAEAIEDTPIITGPNELVETQWRVTSIAARPVLDASPITFAIGADGGARGHGGCNQYFAETEMGPGMMVFGPVAGTRMACDPAVMAQESGFFSALGATTAYALEDGRLRLLDAAGVPLVGLVAQSTDE